MTNQDEFVKKSREQLDHWNAEIAKLQATMAEAQAKGQEQWKQQLDAMMEQRKEAEARLQALADANTAAWKDMQAGYENAWTALQKSFEDARKRYMK
ncbi:hypothetical protein HKCCE2091_07420 [Rhodobacterales bacterium HKCCE2091]|nr:hypothetical protein [Rhodobacterales bacterium HKCCE2091]